MFPRASIQYYNIVAMYYINMYNTKIVNNNNLFFAEMNFCINIEYILYIL